jgi:6-phosphofructokinase 2
MPERKIRTCCEVIDAGGGGINVARALTRFGMAVEAVYFAGGATGRAFDELLDAEGLKRRRVPIGDATRTSLAVHDRSSGEDYRFVPEGPDVEPEEIAAMRAALAETRCDYLIASGSLPPGVPDDFYAEVARDSARLGGRFILDTSGSELEAALAAGGIFLLKASKEEMDRASAEAVVARRAVEMVALTLGADGALLATAEGTFALPSVVTDPISTVGAGDSFLAGMTYGLATGESPLEAFRRAVAAGAAATLRPGTDLCHPEDVARLLSSVPTPTRLD